MITRRALALGLATCALAAQAETPPPFTQPVSAHELETRERSLWQQADEFDRALARSGRLYDDPVLTGYVQGVMDRLFPEFAGVIRVRLVDAPQINAFALPNGSIYVHTGLVARFQNEAQLATVLAHEGAHFLHRHALQQAERVKNAAAFALVAGLLRVPLAGDVLALSSIFGFSREHEREADRVGFARLVAAGYAAEESVRTFQHLQAEIRAAGIREPFFFASHPKLQERIDTLSALVPSHSGGEAGHTRFAEKTGTLRLTALDRDLENLRYKQIILVLTDPQLRQRYPLEAGYHLGEAYRLRDEPGDTLLAEAEFRRVIERIPRHAPSHRALGVLLMKRGEPDAARMHLARYLELSPDARDRAHVEALLNRLPAS